MSRIPLEALDATSSSLNCRSRFGRRADAHHSPYRLRSQSLGYDPGKMTEQAGENVLSSTVTSLHASFDATLMNDEQKELIFRRSTRVYDASSWDESTDGELSGRKHLLQQGSSQLAVLPQTGTIRKLPRRSSNPDSIEKISCVETPRRDHSRPPPLKQTPSSISRRRRALVLQRNSPYRKSPYRKPPTPRAFKIREATNLSTSLFNPQVGTPTRTTPECIKARRKSETCHTAATVDNTVDATPLSPNSTPFRFALFPASLPRVNPRTLVEESSPLDGQACPMTVRKRMTFSKSKVISEGNSDQVDRRVSHTSSTIRDEEFTQNSSISSISAEAFSLMRTVPSFPPPTFECKSPVLAGKAVGIDSKFSEDSDMPESRLTRPTSSINARLFVDDTEYDDSEDSSPAGINVAKTRLNFNLGDSPCHEKLEGQRLNFNSDDSRIQKYDLLGSFVEKRVGRLSSTAPSSNLLQNLSAYRENTAKLPSSTDIPTNQVALCPATPDEVQCHFHVNGTLCSPIPGIPEEDATNDMDVGENEISRCSESEDTLKLSFSQGSSESSTSSKMRRLRPKPDMSAFDAGGTVRSGAAVKSEKNGEEFFPLPPSPKLLCPPTPVRTPAWAHNDHGGNPFVRANSLIVTKVLATCPVQIVDGHSSLENSLIEDEIEHRRNALSFSTVDEEMEEPEYTIQDLSSPPIFRANLERRVPHSSQLRKPQQMLSVPSLPFSNGSPFRSAMAMPTRIPLEPKSSKVLPPKLLSEKSGEVGFVISFASDFENLGLLGRGAFADVYKVRSKQDGQPYAVKRNRRQFRGKRDRDLAMAEVRTMQTLQNVCVQIGNPGAKERKGSFSLYVLFFYRAWQEEGYFFCQTELCCRDTCRELHVSLTTDWQAASRKYPSLLQHLQPNELNTESEMEIDGRLLPGPTIWKICHDVAAGLSHIHSCGIVHHDIKPSNIFLVSHPRFGAMCKIGDLGMAGEIGTCEDGHEGDTMYMAPELLSSGVKLPCADIFSLGLTLYEMSSGFGWELPSEGPQWHKLRSGSHIPELSSTHDRQLVNLIQKMIQAEKSKRPSADDILKEVLVCEAGSRCDEFLRDYIKDTEAFDRLQHELVSLTRRGPDEIGQRTPTNVESGGRELRTPTSGIPTAPLLLATPPPGSK